MQLAVLLLAGALAVAGHGTFAAFSSTASNATGSLTSHPDWTAPTVDATAIAKTAGGVPGYIRQGGTYHVYANAGDTGNPASGVGSLTADVSAATAGQTAAALSSAGGPWTVDGVSYAYRSASLTADAGLSAGTHAYTTAVTDQATPAPTNSRTQSGFSVVADNTAPTGSDVQATNKAGGTVGTAEAGDHVTFTFSETVDPYSILAGWNGTAANVVVRLVDNALADRLLVYDATNTTLLALTSASGVDLGGTSYVSANITFGATGTPSTIVQSGATITVTLGTLCGGCTAGAQLISGTASWPTSTSATDRAGNPVTSASISETGSLDREF